MDSFLSIIIITNNYSHDIATAFLIVSGIMMWLLSKKYPPSDNEIVKLYFIKIYKDITRLARYSLIWVLAAGVPQIIFYKEFEWSNYAGNLQVLAIIVKHVVMFTLVSTGLFYWLKLSKKVEYLKLKT